MTEKHDETTARKEARRRKRRATIRRRLSVGIALAISLVIAFVVLTKSRYLPSQVSSYVNDHYLADSPFEFSCERISGDFVHRVVISNPVLRYHSSSASFNVFRADEVVVDYKVLELTRLNLAIENLLLSNVRLQLRQNESGQLVLPTPKSQARRPSAVSGSVNVERFHVDGLHLFFGGEDRELAVRDVNLVGSVAYRAGVSRLIVEEGTAYVIGSNTPISTLRLDVEHEGSRVTLRDFNARTGESVVVANGGYEAGKLERVQLVFNPISLDEMHELGIIPDLSGEFGGSVICSGAPDSLRIQGTLTGAGFGITLGGMQFDGRVAGDWLEFERVEGRVFGSRIAGAFRYQIAEPHDYSFHGDCRDLDLTQGFVPNAGLPESNFGGGLRLEYNATAGRYHIDAALDSMMFAGYRSRQTEFVGTWADPEGLIIERLVLDRPGYSGEILGSVGSDGAFDLVASANGDDFGYLWDFFSLPQFHGSVNATARATGFVDNLQINLNGDATGMEFLSAHIDTGTVNAEIKGIGTPNVEVKLGISGRHLKTGPLAFEAPRLYLEVDSTGVSIRDLTFARGDTTFTTSFDVDADSTQATIMLHRAGVRTPSDTWQLRHPSRIMWADGELAIDSLELASTRGRLGATGSYSHELGQCELDGWGENVELALLSEVLGTPVGVSGSADFHARVQGDIDRPAIRLDASVSRGHVDSVAFDNLVVRGGFGDTGYALDELRVIAGADTFSLDARWEYPLSPIEIARDGLDARLARSSALNAQARSKHFPLPSFLRAARQRPLLNGVFTGTVEVTGSVADPAVKLRGDIVPRDGDGHFAEDLEAAADEVDVTVADRIERSRVDDFRHGIHLALSAN